MSDALSDSSSDEDTGVWVFYRDRPEWNDVKPVSQDAGPVPVVEIAYTEKFLDVFDYFRAIVIRGEKSKRALELVTDAIDLNPSNYSVWNYRRAILKHLKYDLLIEMQYIEKIIFNYSKNYQVWHHRKAIVEWLGDGFDELAFTAYVLTKDAKNYHAWEHRQWAISKYSLYEYEIDYIDQLLENDVRNNSAWNHRYFVIKQTTGFTQQNVLDQEIDYTLSSIDQATSNESAWNYLRGILAFCKDGLNNKKVLEHCELLYFNKNRSIHLQAFIIDAAVESLQVEPENVARLEIVLKLADDLMNKYDILRCGYWALISDNLKEEYHDLLEGKPPK